MHNRNFKSMKNKSLLASMLLMVASSVMFISCNPFIIQDWAPIEIYVKVSNGEGQNLLDSTTQNNFLNKEVSAEWRGEAYVADTISWREKQHMTRTYLPMMNGLMYVTKDGEQMLYFGEIAGDGDYDDEPLTIHWPDGSTDVITIKNKAHLSSADRKFKLNGEVVAKDTTRPVISIVK